MNLRQHLTICALLLTLQHGDLFSFAFCQGSHPNAAEPEDDVNFPSVGNRWLAERQHVNVIDNNISNNTSPSINAPAIESMESLNRHTPQAAVNQRQEPLLFDSRDSSSALTQSQSGTAANVQTIQNSLSSNQAAPATLQYSNNWQQANPNFAPPQFVPVLATRYPQFLHGSQIFPTAQVLELNPQLNTPSRGASDRAQRLISTRRVVQPAGAAQVASLPLHRQWSMPANTLLNNPNSRSAQSSFQQRPRSIRNTNSFNYLFD